MNTNRKTAITIGAPLILASGLLIMFGFPRFSPISILLAPPIALFEMVLAAYLIVRGFNPSGFSFETSMVGVN